MIKTTDTRSPADCRVKTLPIQTLDVDGNQLIQESGCNVNLGKSRRQIRAPQTGEHPASAAGARRNSFASMSFHGEKFDECIL
jgi:hypothetical protein